MEDKKQYIANKFDHLKSPIDKEAFWSELVNHEAFPSSNKRKRRLFIFFWMGLGLIIGGTSYFTLNRSSHPEALAEKMSIGTFDQNDISCSELNEIHSTKAPTLPSLAKAKNEQVRKAIQPMKTSSKLLRALDAQILEAKTGALLKIERSKPIDLIPYLSPTPLETQSPTLQLNVQKMETEDGEDEFKWATSGYVGIGYSFYSPCTKDSLANVPPGHYEDYIQNRESIAIGLELRRNLPKDWSTGLGAQYTVHYRRFHRKFVDLVSSLDENPDANLNRPYIEAASHTYHHKYKFVDLYADVGKSFQAGNWDLTLAGGIAYQLNFQYSGVVINENKQLSTLYLKQRYEPQNRLYYFGQFIGNYPISEQWDFQIRVKGQSAIRLNTRYCAADHLRPVLLNLGLRFRFGEASPN